MTEYTKAGKEVAERLFIGQGPKHIGMERLCNELGELRTRLEALEASHATEQLND